MRGFLLLPLLLGCDEELLFERDLYVDCDAWELEADGSREHPYPTIRAALNNTGPGDTVWVRGGVYEESIVVPEEISLRAWDGVPRIDGDVRAEDDAEIEGIKITGCLFLESGDPKIRDCRLYGGVVCTGDANPVLEGCRISGGLSHEGRGRVDARGNTWNPNVQGADADGRYPAFIAVGIVAGPNYSIGPFGSVEF